MTSQDSNRVRTQVELGITAWIPDTFFLSETDKLHFYREIEMIEDLEDLQYLKNSFFENTIDTIPEQTENLFFLLEAHILARNYHISHISRLGVNYQIEFQWSNIDTLKDFLRLDSEVKFQVVDISKLRSPTKLFANDKIFLKYLLQILQGTSNGLKKIKLVSKKR